MSSLNNQFQISNIIPDWDAEMSVNLPYTAVCTGMFYSTITISGQGGGYSTLVNGKVVYGVGAQGGITISTGSIALVGKGETISGSGAVTFFPLKGAI